MKIKWLGHSCFLLTSQNGTKVVTDPFNEKVGYKVPNENAHIVTTSHQHYDHNYVSAIKEVNVHLDKPGRYSEKGIDIVGIPTKHDEANGSKRGDNVVFKFAIDGLNICHCGDLGHVLNAEHVESIGTVDVLLVPVGGVYTVDAQDAHKIVELLKPVLTIPMHFKTKPLSFQLNNVEEYIKSYGGKRAGVQEIEINTENLMDFTGTLVLDYE